MSFAQSVNSSVKRSLGTVVVLALELLLAPAKIVFPRFEATLLVDALQEVRRVFRSNRLLCSLTARLPRPRSTRRQRCAARTSEDEPRDRTDIRHDDHDEQPDELRQVTDEFGLARDDVEDAEDPEEQKGYAEHAFAEDHATNDTAGRSCEQRARKQ